MNGFDIKNEVRLTKLEKFIVRNPEMPFDVMARQLNRSYGTMKRAKPKRKTLPVTFIISPKKTLKIRYLRRKS